ncbi:MAG: discoidin domain-containing protein [Flavicella sp.]
MKTITTFLFSIMLSTVVHNSYAQTISSSSVWQPTDNYGEIIDLSPLNAADGNIGSYWASMNGTKQIREEWIALDLDVMKTISNITLTPRSQGQCFPVDFKIQTSTNGENWSVVSGQEYENYTKPTSGTPLDFVFVSPIETQHIRVWATKLRDLNTGSNYMFHLAELGVTQIAEGFSASTDNGEINPVTYAHDNDTNTWWSSNGYNSVETQNDEWIAVNLGDMKTIDKITLTPRGNSSISFGFPEAFKIQTSTNFIEWHDVSGQVYTNYTKPVNNNPIVFSFSEVYTQFIRVLATELSDLSGEGKNYRFQLEEFDVHETGDSLNIKKEVSTVVKVYPNSVIDNLNIIGITPGVLIELYDLSGVLVSSFISESDTHTEDISFLTAGVYLLKSTNMDGSTSYHKIIVE